MTTTTVAALFEAASRQKLRFDSKVGALTTEDLWDLPLTHATKANLDSIAIALNTQLKGSEESFVSTTTKDATLELKFEIVKHIIQERKKAITEALEKKNKDEKRRQLDDLIARKQQGAMESLTLEELEALRASL